MGLSNGTIGYLKHLITIESESVRYGYLATLRMWLMYCMHINHADTGGSVTYSMSLCLFMMLLEMVKDTKVHGCISSFSSLCHTGCKTLHRICNQYTLAHKCFTVQTWAECRYTHVCCHFSNNAQNLHDPSIWLCLPPFASYIQLMLVLVSLHICVRVCVVSTAKHNHENHHSAVIHKRTAHPSLYSFPTKKLLRLGNPAVLNRVLLVWLPV